MADPIYTDYIMAIEEDSTLYFSGNTSVGDVSYRFQAMRRFNGVSGLIALYVSPNNNGTSGITITNSGLGLMSFFIPALFTSGWDPGAYAYDLQETSVGSHETLQEGYLLVEPDTGI